MDNNILIRLLKWLPNKSCVNYIYIKNINKIRGIYTNKKIKSDAIIMEIPYKYLISSSNIYKTKGLRKIDKSIYPNNALITLYLIYQYLLKKNKWKIYFDSIGEKGIGHSIFYNKDIIKNLKKTSFMNNYNTDYESYIKKIKNEVNTFQKMIDNKQISLPTKISKKEFTKLYYKYRSLVGSRVFGIYTNNGKETVMVPIADLLNHSTTPNVSWKFNTTKDVFEVITTRIIKKGEQIYDSYGTNLSNSHLLLYYGFTYPSNKNDVIILKTRSKQIIKIKYYEDIKDFTNNNRYYLNTNNDSNDNILKILGKLEKDYIKQINNNKRRYDINHKNLNNILRNDISLIKNNIKFLHLFQFKTPTYL